MGRLKICFTTAEEDPSRVIITASVAGIGVGSLGKNATFGYSASKAAVIRKCCFDFCEHRLYFTNILHIPCEGLILNELNFLNVPTSRGPL